MGEAAKKESKPDEKVLRMDSIEFINDVTLQVVVELGRTDLTIDRITQLKRGSVIEIEKLSEEPLDIRINGRLVARGEAVIVNEMFGIRVTQVVAPEGDDVI
ncbi:MAG: flagellar motor switch protein FliN [Bdellovibrionales bacterium]|nr:flagellar motor switch protein FliN [Bdellovibrionales bacterium]